MSTVDTSLAALSGIAGVASLFAAWRERWPRRIAVSAGWGLLVLSCVLWVRAAGAEFGLVYAPLGIALCGWLAVGLTAEPRRGAPERAPAYAALGRPDRRSLARHVLLFVYVVPLAGLASILASVTLAHRLPWEPANALVAGILMMPLLWGLAAYWIVAASRPLRPALALAACAALCAAYVYG